MAPGDDRDVPAGERGAPVTAYRVWIDGLGGCLLNAEHTRAATFATVGDALEAGIAKDAPFRVVDADDTSRVRATWSRDVGVRLYDCDGCDGKGRTFVGWGRGWDTCPRCGGSGRKAPASGEEVARA